GAGCDTFSYLIKEAKKRDISVHAWINLLSIAQNEKANIVKTFGKSVLTLDQHGKTSMKDVKDPLDKYYIREDQIFLEPGNANVRKYLSNIAGEVVKKYPGLSGLHLDYIRYPSVVPFIPGSRFTSHGLSYGYDEGNLASFKKTYGVDIISDKYSRQNFLLWDSFRRNNVTSLLRDISKKVRGINPELKISTTIMPSIERTYLTTLQDWTLWLDEGYTDYVVAMNYTDDDRLFAFYTNSIISQRDPKSIMVGVGPYLLKDMPDVLYKELGSLLKTPASGIVLFSYDDISGNANLQKFLTENFNKK
ncbi:MAG: family 10 glycosylhydrolase, partial [Candidatus Omnitrophota bacterium]